MNDVLLLLQMLQNGDLGGGSSEKPFIILDEDGQIQKPMSFMAGNTAYEGYNSDLSDPSKNVYSFIVGHSSGPESAPYVFDSESDLVSTLNEIISKASEESDLDKMVASVLNVKIVILDHIGVTILSNFMLLSKSVSRTILSCDIHFEDSLMGEKYEGDTIGTFSGKLLYGTMNGNNIAALDARFGVCNLRVIPHQPL